MSDNEIKLSDVQRLEVGPDEILLIKVPASWDHAHRDRAHRALSQGALRGIRFLIHPDNVEFTVVKANKENT